MSSFHTKKTHIEIEIEIERMTEITSVLFMSIVDGHDTRNNENDFPKVKETKGLAAYGIGCGGVTLHPFYCFNKRNSTFNCRQNRDTHFNCLPANQIFII
jgi:hypothetical protein